MSEKDIYVELCLHYFVDTLASRGYYGIPKTPDGEQQQFIAEMEKIAPISVSCYHEFLPSLLLFLYL